MAYLKTIYPRDCVECGATAIVILHNRRNEELNAYCGQHRVAALDEQQGYDDREAQVDREAAG